MFLSPNIEGNKTSVTINGEEVNYVADTYFTDYSANIGQDDWKYAILSDEKLDNVRNDEQVDTIMFQIDFESNEELNVTVSYRYRLGGYPDYDSNIKRGEIEYYLTPANMWKDFSNLTINLYLDKDMPIIESSNLEFEKIASRTYQYISDTLPEDDLRIMIDENMWQSFLSSFRNPYMLMYLYFLWPILLIILIVIVFNVWIKHKYRKKNM